MNKDPEIPYYSCREPNGLPSFKDQALERNRKDRCSFEKSIHRNRTHEKQNKESSNFGSIHISFKKKQNI